MSDLTSRERAIVIFDTKYGNTGKVAKSLAGGLNMAGVETDCVSLAGVRLESLGDYDFIAVGGPTQMRTASGPLKDFLSKLGDLGILRGKRGFAFDTKLSYPLVGSAAKHIEKVLSDSGARIIARRQSAIVEKEEGPIRQGELEAFEKLGFDIGGLLTRSEPATEVSN